MLSDSVAELGLTALTAKDGEEAIALIEAEPVDLLITDIRMGAISGWEVGNTPARSIPPRRSSMSRASPAKASPSPAPSTLRNPFAPTRSKPQSAAVSARWRMREKTMDAPGCFDT
jgi:CheY-like chemotaxis protein